MTKLEAEKLKEILLREQTQEQLKELQKTFLNGIDWLNHLRELANNRDKREWAIQTLSAYAALRVPTEDNYLIGQLYQEACWRINGEWGTKLLEKTDWVVALPRENFYIIFFVKDDQRYTLHDVFFEDVNA